MQGGREGGKEGGKEGGRPGPGSHSLFSGLNSKNNPVQAHRRKAKNKNKREEARKHHPLDAAARLKRKRLNT